MIMKFAVNTATTFLVLYNSFNAYKAKKYNQKIRKHYSHYFLIMSVLLAVDAQLAFITNHVPFYQFVKLVGVTWLSIPVCSGSVFVYKFYLSLLFKENEHRVDEWLEAVRIRMHKIVLFYYELAYSTIKQGVQKVHTPLPKEGAKTLVKKDAVKSITGPSTPSLKSTESIVSQAYVPSKESLDSYKCSGEGMGGTVVTRVDKNLEKPVDVCQHDQSSQQLKKEGAKKDTLENSVPLA